MSPCHLFLIGRKGLLGDCYRFTESVQLRNFCWPCLMIFFVGGGVGQHCRGVTKQRQD